MKKLSLIVALAVVLTVGGVFATWNYGGSAATPGSQTVTVGVAEESLTGVKGTIAVTGSNLAISIDKAADSYTAVLVKSGTATITYTKDPTASATHNTVQLKASISVATAGNTYDGNDVIIIDTAEVNLGTYTTGVAQTIGFGAGDKDLASCISIADITLPTYDDYLAFDEDVEPIITITITDVTPVAP